MRKRTLIVGFFVVLAVVLCMNAYAADGGGSSPWVDFWNGVGGFFYNALPWNWGSWVGK